MADQELDIYSSLAAVGLGALNASIQLMRALANDGLVSPETVDTIAHSITVPFEELDSKAARQFRALVDGHMAPPLAEIYRAAKANYRPPEKR